jgi:hypothetical protein
MCWTKNPLFESLCRNCGHHICGVCRRFADKEGFKVGASEERREGERSAELNL